MSDADVLSVLVAIDFSDASHAALAWALDYALRAPCELHLVHVVEDHLSDLLRGPSQERVIGEMYVISRDAEVELARMAPGEEDRQRVGAIHRHVATGRPGPQLLAMADNLEADLIVMGSSGRTGLAGALIGSVAEKIVRHSTCPVLCVKAPPPEDE